MPNPVSDNVDLSPILESLKTAISLKKYNKAGFFKPYPKQVAFFDAGAWARERLLTAGNQLGKTEAGAYETMLHLTGEYPDWWQGKVFDHPTRGWIVGETSLLVRDVQQKKLCGEPGVEEAFGTGFIPRAAFCDKPSLSRGVTDAYDTIQVRHKTGGISIARFKSYEQGRAKMQGETLDFVWCDEEPPADIYSEILTRTNAAVGGMGISYITFTPLKGMTSVVESFLNTSSPDKFNITMTMKDVTHISESDKIKIAASYPPHEREARVNGIPMMGSGRIFPYQDEMVIEPSLSYIPPVWGKMWGIDFGIGHPFAAVLGAWDKDNDVIHILHAIRRPDELPINHAAAMRPIGAAVPVAWPHDGNAREFSGSSVISLYRAQGLIMLPTHATFPDGSISTEAGILEMQERITTGRLKVAAHLSEWFEEFHMYHRKDGLIVKVKDDLMSATRVFIMAKRFARAVPLGGTKLNSNRRQSVAEGIDFDVFD